MNDWAFMSCVTIITHVSSSITTDSEQRATASKRKLHLLKMSLVTTITSVSQRVKAKRRQKND